jgi:L-alanine-DL-glutamate epimerase-like enolase superfamily enzyme
MKSKIQSIEVVSCDAGWRNYHFCKLTTDDGIVGWSEFDEGFGAPGVGYVIRTLSSKVTGLPVGSLERMYATLWALTRPASGGVVGLAIAAIENAMFDAKAKTLGVPCYELLGGKVRNELRVYWSHCATWRITRPEFYKPGIRNLDEVEAMGREVRSKGYTALKTNNYYFESDRAVRGWAPGFGGPFYPELNANSQQIKGLREHLEALRSGAGSEVEILLDLNFNFTPEGAIKIVKSLSDFELFWVEYDNKSASVLADVRRSSPHPISSCETLIGQHHFVPFLNERAVDVAIVDVIWNGAWQAIKIAAAAHAVEINVAPHNFYGHLSTMMSAHFAAAIPNLRIVELDVDRIENDHLIFTHEPEVRNGFMQIPDRPGWGTEPDEEYIRTIPAEREISLMTFNHQHETQQRTASARIE